MDDGEFVEVEVDEVDVGDVLLVKTGAKVPVDGTVLTGEGSVNEASITGNLFPLKRKKAQMYLQAQSWITVPFKLLPTVWVKIRRLVKLLNW